MKYSHREDREIRRRIRKSLPYESRKKSKAKYAVDQKVQRIAHGLGGLGQDEPYISKYAAPAPTHNALLDKYYIPSHYPSRDILTELGNVSTVSKIPVGIVATVIVYLLFVH